MTTAPPEPPRSRSRLRRLTPYLLLAPGLVWLVVFYLGPLGSLLSTSLMAPVPGGELGQFQPAADVANYGEALAEYWPNYLRSFWYALLATATTLVVGFPIAYAIAVKAREHRTLQQLLLVLVIAPFFVGFVLRTIAWRQLLADEAAVVGALQFVGLLPEGGRLLATPFAVVAGLSYSFLPFMVLPIYAALERLDKGLLQAASDCYASPWAAFWHVTVPLAAPGILAGTLLTFIPASGDFVNATLLGNPQTVMVGSVIDARFFRVVDYPTASALSVMLMVIVLVLVLGYVRWFGTRGLR